MKKQDTRRLEPKNIYVYAYIHTALANLEVEIDSNGIAHMSAAENSSSKADTLKSTWLIRFCKVAPARATCTFAT